MISLALLVLLGFCVGNASAQGNSISFTVDTGEGLVYLLLILFFVLYYITPVVRYVYVHYLTELVERAGQQVVKAQKRMTEKLSDAGRKVSQSIRSV
ncbi:hypothetical protein EON65_25570 [archaeon]|nr:MAG: hypothetical protein EON65_25570 [archaeon]